METKIINVFYNTDLLPYKDVERQVHYPITSGAFLGASNTTKIRFYFDYIGDESTTWVSVAKLPNGKQGSKVLSVASDENGNYAELELSNWYTQAKGDVYIALQGYQGGVEYSYDSETELYEIHGTPTIQTTGSIKLAINYAPIGDSPDYTDEYTTYQEILAALGDKANVDSVYTKAETDTALEGKVDKKETIGPHAYTHDGSAQGEIKVEIGNIGGAIVQRTDNAQIIVPYTPSADINATSKRYVDNTLTSGLATKQDRLVSGTNIKTINGQSVLGSGDLEVGGSGSAEWGAITGDIQDQTDLQDELQDIREVAEGKTNSFSVDTDTTGNSVFKSDDEVITATSFVDVNGNTINVSDLNVGDLVFTLNTNTNKYKDRWLIDKTLGTWGLIDADTPNLSGYATKTELSESVENLAQPYDSTVIYSIGDKVVYNDKLYSCLVNMSAAESWDSTHWVQITVANRFVDLDKEQVITGVKKMTRIIFNTSAQYIGMDGNNKIMLGQSNNDIRFYDNNIRLNTPLLRPQNNNTTDLGTATLTWKDLYLGGNISDGTNSVSVAHLAQNTPIQWYGTQAQYDALGTYDSNTIYNVLES